MKELSQHVSQDGSSTTAPTRGPGTIFGVPVGDLGWFATLLTSAALGFMTFFASTFIAIMSILIYNSATHGAVDFALSYKRVGLPIGVVVMAVSLLFLGTLWVRRQLRRS